MPKRKGAPQSDSGERDVRRINLNNCVSEDPSIYVPVSQVEGIYEVFRPVPAGKIQHKDLIIQTQRSRPPCPSSNENQELRRRCSEYEEVIDEHRRLILFSEAYHFYGNKVILPQLKRRNSGDRTIQRFRHWHNCTQQITEWKTRRSERYEAVQHEIYAIVGDDGIARHMWNELVWLNMKRNEVAHRFQSFSHQDRVDLLNDAENFTGFDNLVSDAPAAVRRLITALEAIPSTDYAGNSDNALANLYP